MFGREEFAVKEEPEWDTEGDEAALAELYADHVVKKELVFGPELLQRKDAGVATYVKFFSSKKDVCAASKHNPFSELDQYTDFSELDNNRHVGNLHISDGKQKTLDKNFNVTHVNRGSAEANSRKNKIELEPVFQSELSDHDCYRISGVSQEIIDAKTNLITSAQVTNSKDHEKHIVIKHSVKENNQLANKSDSKTKNCYDRDIKSHWSKGKNKKLQNTEKKKVNTCEICKKSYANHVNLIRHKQIHTGQKYTCKICNKEFVQSYYLKRHEKIHSNSTRTLIKCDYCPKQFTDRSNYNRHKRYHKGEKLYTCEICGKQFGQKIHLITHQFSHSEKKPHSCDVCLKQFTYKHRLTAHKRIHAGMKPYRCQICPKRFIAKCRLTRHEILIHGARLSYICDVCKKQFNTRKDIMKHIANSH